MPSAYDFAVNIVMLINITINKTQYLWFGLKIIYAASIYNSENIIMVIKHFHDLLIIIHVAKGIWIFYEQEYVLIYLKSTKSAKFLTCLK